jgi:23S rRNA (cytosine1962-C5)-methyltransferase
VSKITLLKSEAWRDYDLVDSGNGKKLERFGEYLFIRPEHQAVWKPSLNKSIWGSAHACFQPTAKTETGGKWESQTRIKSQWKMEYKHLKFWARFTKSRHLGAFPEQAPHWDWIEDQVCKAEMPLRVLNLFGYTGLASLSAANAGAHVTHVDASKGAVSWAKENQTLSGLNDRPIRWIVDDAMKFVRREHRRNVTYGGIIMDPPKFGRGPKGEIWSGLDMLPKLLAACRDILTANPRFIIITAYAIRASALSLLYLLDEMMSGFNGETNCGELVTVEQGGQRMISQAIFGRWSAVGSR